MKRYCFSIALSNFAFSFVLFFLFLGAELFAITSLQTQSTMDETLSKCRPKSPGFTGQDVDVQPTQANCCGGRVGSPLLGAVL